MDAIKSQLVTRLGSGRSIRFGDTLDATYFEQLTGERRVAKYSCGHPNRRFERIPSRRMETLDCMTYAFAARQLVGLDLGRREEELTSVTGEKKHASVIRSKWITEAGFW